jgi:hypothetical protein
MGHIEWQDLKLKENRPKQKTELCKRQEAGIAITSDPRLKAVVVVVVVSL